MPPRQPLKLKGATKSSPKTPTRPVVSAVSPALQPSAPPSKPSRLGNLLKAATQGQKAMFSPYPDLTLAIAMLAKRRQQLTSATTPDDRMELIDKWLLSLNKVQAEMTRLRQLESLTATLGRRESVT